MTDVQTVEAQEAEADRAAMRDISEEFLNNVSEKYNAVVILLSPDSRLGFATNIPKDMAARLMGMVSMQLLDDMIEEEKQATVQ